MFGTVTFSKSTWNEMLSVLKNGGCRPEVKYKLFCIPNRFEGCRNSIHLLTPWNIFKEITQGEVSMCFLLLLREVIELVV